METGRLSPETEAEILHDCWSPFAGMFGRAVRSAAFCLGALAAAVIAVVVATGGLGATRAALRPLPYEHPERILALARNGYWPNQVAPVTPEDIAAWKLHSRAIEDIAPYYWLHRGGEIREACAGDNFFELLGVRPALGRPFQPGDRAGAVLAHETWRERFGADPAIAGRRVEINARPVEVLGVLPPGFWFISRDIEVWTVLDAAAHPRTGAVARLRPGAHPLAALGQIRTIARRLYPGEGRRQLAYASVLEDRVRGTLTPFRWGLGAALLAAVCLSAAACVKGLRFGLFLLAKSTMLLFALAALCCEGSVAHSLSMLGWSGRAMQVAAIAAYYLAAPLALLWMLADQRRRCRVCLSRLATPTRFGSPASWLLDPMGTELLCERGHGTLYVPSTHASSQRPEGWTELDESWRELFQPGPKG